VKTTHLFVLPASLMALAGCGGTTRFDEPAAEVEKAKLVTVAEALAPLPAPAKLLAPGVEQALAALGEGELTVDVFLAEGTLEEPMAAEAAAGEVREDGTLVAELNGAAARPEDFARYAERFGAQLRDREARLRELNRQRWRQLAASYGLSRELAAVLRDGGSSATVRLPGRALRALSDEQGRGLLRSITLPHVAEGNDGMTSALASVEVSTQALPNGWNGTGIGVWMNDGDGKPITSTACVDTGDLTLQDVGAQPFETHSTQTLCTLMATAPEAHVHYAVPTQSCNLRSDVTTFTSPQVFVSSQSNTFGDNGTPYSDCSRDWDNFIYNTRIVHFAAAGNQASDVIGAAKAYNVFGIGAYADEANPDAIASFSNFGDPETGADKPEFVAPGVDIDVGSWTGINGTSFAAPIAGGFAADLLQRYSFLRLQPALLKSYLMVNSVRIDGTELVGDTDGAGRLDFSNAAFGRWYWWGGNNASHFTQDTDGDGRKEIVVEYDLVAGQTYHVATSWLVQGSYVRDNKKPNMDVDLTVIAPNNTTWSSVSVVNNYEMVRVVAPVSGTYTFKVERYWNSGVGDVSVGLVIRAR